ncbi:MAG: hypothetical protein ABIX12_01260 [Rubrivivax sp.]
MLAFRNVALWFIALLVITVVGFWPTYFSQLPGGPHLTHHLHGITMLLWVLLLITQALLVRTHRIALHRRLGRVSLVLAPLVVLSGIVVTLHNIRSAPNPTHPFMLGLYAFGWFLSLSFGLLWGLAMVHRRDVQLHARYMITTALVLLFPGFYRALTLAGEALDLPVPGFYDAQYLIGAAGLALIVWDLRRGRVRAPFVVFTGLWALNLLLWKVLPNLDAWRRFTAWSAAL